ncbi:MAG: FAD:protein FMN transferase [Fidelibacterota bacterium]|nr:MAG: FAD:protein FMN transferase [Candidatus Neomarinimicrobiota bacterium]
MIGASHRQHRGWFPVYVLMVSGLLLVGCARQEQPWVFQHFAMGTAIEYTIVTSRQAYAHTVVERAHREIERIESLFSENDTTSEVYRFNHSVSGIYVSEEVSDCIRRALDYSRQTSSAFNIVMKPVLDLYGFQALMPAPPTDLMIRRALAYTDIDKLELHPGDEDRAWWLGKDDQAVAITMGGFVKGYAVDRAIQVIRDHRIDQALINAGGDLYCLGTKKGLPWIVGIQHPREAQELLLTLALADRAVATSGDYQRFYFYEGKRYHHLLDPATGKPSRNAWSATVVANTTEEADAWATALFILGPDAGIRLLDAMKDVCGMVVDSSGTVHYSRGFQQFVQASDNHSELGNKRENSLQRNRTK